MAQHNRTDNELKADNQVSQFEQIVMPHLDAAYNLARWLTRNDHDAEDLVQMTFVRAVRFFDGYKGGNARAWLMTILRNTFYTSHRDNQQDDIHFDETIHSHQETTQQGMSFAIGSNPEKLLESRDTCRSVNQALEKLPTSFREIIILKEMEEFSYKEIADITGIPIGTVMSRLARGRKLLLVYLEGFDLNGLH